MKHLSAFEVTYVVSELQSLLGGRLSQVYQPVRKELILQLYLRNKGAALLKVRVPYSLYLASEKAASQGVGGFCSALRRKLNNGIIRAISQPGFERIVRLDISSKNGLFSLFFELFSKGNIILVYEGKIALAEEKQSWSSREIAPGQPYCLPPTSTDPQTLDEKNFQNILKSTKKTDLVRFLALELSLGGLYAEELCLLSEIDKKTKPSALSPTNIKVLVQQLKKLLSSKQSPSIILEKGQPIDAVPIQLTYYKHVPSQPTSTFSEALEKASVAPKRSSFQSEISRLQTIIDKQQQTVIEARTNVEENKRKGEILYENYQEVKQLLEDINAARKSSGWSAVKQLQKSNKKLKSIDEKMGKIVVDL